MKDQTATSADVVVIQPGGVGLAEFQRTHQRILEGLHEYVSRMPIAYVLAGDLRYMRDARLYLNVVRDNGKPKLKTFADYIQYLNRDLKVIGFQHRATAYKVFKETAVLVRLSDSTKDLPVSRSIFAELAKLQPDHQTAVWLDLLKTTPAAKARPADVQAAATKLYHYTFAEPAKSQSEILADLRERAPAITPLIVGEELTVRWMEFLVILNPPKRERRQKTAPAMTVGNSVSIEADIDDQLPPEAGEHEIAAVTVPPCPTSVPISDAPGADFWQSPSTEGAVDTNQSQLTNGNVNDAAPVPGTGAPAALEAPADSTAANTCEESKVVVTQPADASATPVASSGEVSRSAKKTTSQKKRQVTARAEVDGAFAVIGFPSRDDYFEIKGQVDLAKLGFTFTRLKWRRNCDETGTAAAFVTEVVAKLRDAGVTVETAA